MSTSSLCDRCGAMLPLPDLEGRVSCLSCGRSVKVAPAAGPLVSDGHTKRSSRTGPKPAATKVDLDSTGTPRPTWNRRPPSRARRLIRRALVTAFVLALVTPILRDRSDHDSTPSPPRYSLKAGSTLLLPSEGATTDLLAVMVDRQARRHVVVRYSYAAENTGGGDLIWASDPLANDGYEVSYAVDGDDLYLVTRSEAWKLDLATGERQWVSQLPDLVPPRCPDCFSVIDGHLVAQTIDGQVSALASDSGEELWSRRFDDPGGSVAVAHGRLLVVDESTEADTATVYRLDAATGDEQNGQILRCAVDDRASDVIASVSTEVFAVPESTDVVAFFGLGVGCVMRWDVDSAEIGHFDEDDRAGMEALCVVFMEAVHG